MFDGALRALRGLALLLTGCLLYHVEWLSSGFGIVRGLLAFSGILCDGDD